MSNYTVGYIIGSLSAESINRTLSKALIRLAPDNLAFQEISIRDLPLYNHDFDEDYPLAGPGAQGRHRRGRRGAVRDARVQPRPSQAA